MQRDISVEQSEAAIREAAEFSPSEATRFLFDHFRTMQPETQPAFVLALIANVVTHQAIRRANGGNCAPQTTAS
jgi:hypothetical protein